ncbi:MAG: HAMP domain-containing histidine kinase [Candidatus Nomurabacteria bacterium]|nr:HAMP domain-containing histidine kinase [Candidatus Nomurabacteria bacterium]
MRRTHGIRHAVALVLTVGALAILVIGGIAFHIVAEHFNSRVAKTSSSLGEVYRLSDGEITKLKSGKTITLNDDKNIINVADSVSSPLGKVIRGPMPVPTALIIFVGGILAAVIFTWAFLIWLARRHDRAMISHMKDRDNEPPSDLFIDPKLEKAYLEIKRVFDSHLDDLQRLQSYITHEQKNSVAILRMHLEQSGDKEGLKLIGELVGDIDDVLTISDQAGAKGELADVALAAAKVCDRYSTIAKIHFKFDENADYHVAARGRWVVRSISNLIDNAVKYGQKKPIDVSAWREGTNIIVKVQDHGVGIAPDEVDKVFSYHYRAVSPAGHFDGSGIGLGVVEHVAELTGGRAWVESQLGRGSTFYLSFPAAETAK